jgi:uncharacterized membrane protein YeaQ/YmgE (transglycosylase-associated protein family)
MTLEAILIILVVGAVAGWLAGLIVRGAGFGLIGDIIIGWLFPRLGVHLMSGIVGSILNATIGAVILLLVIRLIRRA